MNKEQLRKYIEMRIQELEACLKSPYHIPIIEARLNELRGVLKQFGTR